MKGGPGCINGVDDVTVTYLNHMAMLWMWKLCVSCVFTRLSVGASVAEEDDSRYYLYIEETLQINCSLPVDSRWSAHSLEFTLNNDLCSETEDGLCEVSSEQVQRMDDYTIQLTRVMHGLEGAGEYICWLHTPADDFEIMQPTYAVFVQYRPKKVEEVRCEAYDWDVHLTCEWNYGINYTDHSQLQLTPPQDMAINASVLAGSGPAIPCPDPLSMLKTRCQWSGTHFPSAAHYTLEVKVTNSEKQHTKIRVVNFTLKDIVKPSALASMDIKDKNSTCVTMRMTHARAQRDKIYRVEVTTAPNDTLVKIQEGESSDVTLCGLEPFTSYIISAQCRAADSQGPHGFWSDVIKTFIRTAETAPGASFEVHAGSYVRHICNDTGYGDVTMLWKAVPPEERHGIINGYRLVYSNRTVEVTTPSPSPPTSALLPHVPCTSPVSVVVFSRNTAGVSTASSSILILPPQRRQEVVDFAVEVSDTGVRAVWKASTDLRPFHTTAPPLSTEDPHHHLDVAVDDDGDSVPSFPGDSVTVFCCVKNKMAVEPTCRGEIEWMDTAVSDGQLDMTGQCRPSTPPQDHLWGISPHHRQGILWTTCLFNPNEEITAPEGVRVAVEEGEMWVGWRVQRCTHIYPVHVTGYRLHFCPQPHCPDSTRTVEVQGWHTDHTTVPVTSGQEYVIMVQVLAFGDRVGPLSAPVTGTPLSPTAPVVQNWLIACIVVIAALILIGFTFVTVKCCRDATRRRTRMFSDPELLVTYHAVDGGNNMAGNSDPHITNSQSEEVRASPTCTATTVMTMITDREPCADSPPQSPASPALTQKLGHRDLWGQPSQDSRDVVLFHVHASLVEGEQLSSSDGAAVSLLPDSRRSDGQGAVMGSQLPHPTVHTEVTESKAGEHQPLMCSSAGPDGSGRRHEDIALCSTIHSRYV